MGIKL